MTKSTLKPDRPREVGANPPATVFTTRRRDRDQKRNAVLTAAAELFLTKGYNNTRLDDIAESLCLTKPALYNYFRSKHDVLFGCHMLGHDLIDASLEDIEQGGGNGLFKLKALIRAYAGVMTQKFGMCLVRLDEHELSPKAREEVRRRRRQVNDRLEGYILQGVTDGSIIPCQPAMTAFGIAGALNWISFWYDSRGEFTASQIGDYFAESLTRGIAAQLAPPAWRPPPTDA